MTEQLAFDLPAKPALGRGDFLVAPCNAAAAAQIADWRDWPEGKLALIGPPGAGKTHLVHVWAAETGARVLPAKTLNGADAAALAATGAVAVEDVDGIAGPGAETTLLHLHNLLRQSGGALLLTATLPPIRWPIALPDLASRMQAAVVAEIGAPDDRLLAGLLVKLFTDRQLKVTQEVLDYTIVRMERSFAAARHLVEVADRAALAAQRSITIPLMRDILAADGRAESDVC